MLIIVGEAEAASGRRDRMLEAAAAMAAATQSDDGCDMYGFYVDVSRPDVILSVEVWRDQAALDAHMDHRAHPGVPGRRAVAGRRHARRCASSRASPRRRIER